MKQRGMQALYEALHAPRRWRSKNTTQGVKTYIMTNTKNHDLYVKQIVKKKQYIVSIIQAV